MKLDLTSFAFGFEVANSNGNPNWATSLGQGASYKINENNSINEILKGMVYTSIPLASFQTRLGKGGKIYNGTNPESGIILGSVFNKVYANNLLVDGCRLILIITRDFSASHTGRLRIKYSPHNAMLDSGDSKGFSNQNEMDKIRRTLNLEPGACWFVYEINVVNQDELHLKIGVPNSTGKSSYLSPDDLRKSWTAIIAEDNGKPTITSASIGNSPRQQITYGAPGTGKSHGIEEIVERYGDTIRTTFHPDSDYSTFVGCYKPTVEKRPKYGPQGVPIKVNGVELTEDVISYSYVPQAFTKAYLRAWSKLFDSSITDDEKCQFLVIEEINRGNCAQIFGDLFQLLDRKGDGYSKYPIEADTDLARYIEETLGQLSQEAKANILPDILSGKKLVLPPNLYIWATMNTSDQSLFPMDSAFKRRWEWKYIPIKDAGKGWKIVANGEAFSWWDFLEAINKSILDALKNEDKQLGYFFARPSADESSTDESDIITASTFVNKVLFYLYNDVFKDYELPMGFVKAGGGKFAFADFFLAGGEPNEVSVKELLSNLLPKAPQPIDANV